MELPTKISEKTVISFQVVVIFIGFAIWLIKLGDKVDQHEKAMLDLATLEREMTRTNEKIDHRLYRLEERLGIKHANEDRE